MKLLNSNIGKSNTDSKDRYDMLNNELMVFENACNSMIADLKNKVKVDDNSLEERIQLAVERIKERLTSQLDGAVLDYNKLVRDNNRLLQEKFEQNNHDVKSFIEKKTDEMRGKIIEERKKLDTIVEGRCQAFTIEIERKILQKMNLVMNEN